MRDSYVGNIRDFAKYGLLRALVGITTAGERLPPGVVWYDSGTAGRESDRVWGYLHEPDEWRGCDEDLFDSLRRFVDHKERSIRRMKALDVLNGAANFCDDISMKERPDWRRAALARTEGVRVVLLDPDIGLAPPSQAGKNSRKHAYPDDVRPFVERGQAVVVYQSYVRNTTHDTQQQRWHDDLQLALGPGHRILMVKFNSGLNPPVQCAFIVVAAHNLADRINDRLRQMLQGDWGRHFERL